MADRPRQICLFLIEDERIDALGATDT